MTKTPTIKHILNCLPKNGIESAKDQLELYAHLSFYFDGEDLSKAKVNKIRAKQKLMDEKNPTQTYQIVEGDDCYTLIIDGLGSYLFNIPTLENMPEINRDNLATSLKDSVNKLAANPEEVYKLPYQYFPALVEVLGKSIGLAE